MKKRTGSKEELDSYIESVKARQRNLIWPDLLRGSRSVDEFLWKGASDAPLVQRIGAVILALAYLMVGGGVHCYGCGTRKMVHSRAGGHGLRRRRMVYPERS
jgi:hypothetical protein